MTGPLFESILVQVRRRYSSAQFDDRYILGTKVGEALMEGLPALARIAFTARIGRRTLRFGTFQVESARKIVEGAVGAAEKASSGESMSVEEALQLADEPASRKLRRLDRRMLAVA